GQPPAAALELLGIEPVAHARIEPVAATMLLDDLVEELAAQAVRVGMKAAARLLRRGIGPEVESNALAALPAGMAEQVEEQLLALAGAPVWLARAAARRQAAHAAVAKAPYLEARQLLIPSFRPWHGLRGRGGPRRLRRGRGKRALARLERLPGGGTQRRQARPRHARGREVEHVHRPPRLSQQKAMVAQLGQQRLERAKRAHGLQLPAGGERHLRAGKAGLRQLSARAAGRQQARGRLERLPRRLDL